MEILDFTIIIFFSNFAFIFTWIDLKYSYVNALTSLYWEKYILTIYLLKVSNKCKKRENNLILPIKS